MRSFDLGRKKLSIMVVGLFVAAIAGFLIATNANSTESQSRFVTKCDTGVVCVDLSESGASPPEIAVEVGNSVQFNAKGNSGTMFHLASKDEQGSLHSDHGAEETEHISSGDFSGDEAWKVEFKEVGSYQFVDEYNLEIEILVVVYKPGAKNTIE